MKAKLFFKLSSRVVLYSIVIFSCLAVSCNLIKTVKLMKAGETKQKQFKTEVPFEMRMGLIILKVKVNGVDAEYLLDTGAPNVISKELAQTLKITSKASRKAGDSQGKKSELGFAKINCINIGGIDFLETGTAIADLKQSAEVACLKVDGLLGANLMRKAIWKFDYNKKIITICSSRDSLTMPAASKKIKFITDISGTPLIEVIYNGISDKNVEVDLGSNGDFNSSKTIFENLKKSGGFTQSTYSYGQDGSGLYGKAATDTTFYAMISSIKTGDVELNNQIVLFSKGKAKTVGTGYFKNNDLILDWGKNELLLIEKTSYNNNANKKVSYSILFKDNQLFIGSVDENNLPKSPKLGDQVLSINGRNYKACSHEEWCDILYNNPLKTIDEINLTVLRDGKEYNISTTRSQLFIQP